MSKWWLVAIGKGLDREGTASMALEDMIHMFQYYTHSPSVRTP